jgi:hypothetical protein
MSMAVSGSKALSAIAVADGVLERRRHHSYYRVALARRKGMLLNETLIVLALLIEHRSPLECALTRLLH